MREPGLHGDYVKFAFIGKVWGLPHPTGFPLFLILDGLVSLIPIGTLTFRVMTISATFTALAIYFIYRIVRQIGASSPLALGLALIAATGHAIWAQAVIPEVYGLNMFFIMASVWALFRWDKTDDDRWMWATVWLFILGLSDHPTIILTFPALLAFTLIRKPGVYLRSWTWIHAATALVIVLGLYSYIYIRSRYNLAHEDFVIGGDFRRFLSFIEARAYFDRSSDISFAINHTPSGLIAYIKTNWNLLMRLGAESYTIPGWIAVLIAVPVAFLRNWKRAIIIVLVPAGLAVSNFIYMTTEPESYFAPVYLFAPLVLGSLAMFIIEKASSWSVKVRKPSEYRLPIRASVIAAASILLLAGTAGNILRNSTELDRTIPDPCYAVALRISRAIQAPAVVFTPDYKDTMLISYCHWGDGIGDGEPVAPTQKWDSTIARNALLAGKHVYIYADCIDKALGEFEVEGVDTGIDETELYELRLPPGSPL